MARATSLSFLGLFAEPDDAAAAMDALRSSGFEETDLEVLTNCPFPEGAFGEPPPKHHFYVFPLVGGACGLLVGMLLVIGTQLYYPLVTGGKPILSIPPILNILFEGVMLGCIVVSFFGFLFEARLTGVGRIPWDKRISDGYIGVAVLNSQGREAAARRSLLDAGAIDVIGGQGNVVEA
ncbi:MAG TPA: quinol:electron acceptor oxidoreductase subunit ActD [Chloroflexota bacterium]|nr:quinol:electron acceptor oxidoreductase subunit ActD [Chloroflexota bacterium]